MTPEAQRIAIAEACGWNAKPEPTNKHDGQCWGFSARFPKWWYAHQLPDYLSDLNAMHEAEKALTNEQRTSYINRLKGCLLNGWWDLTADEAFIVAHATAAQRAEAFRRTLNLWTD